MNLHYQEMRMNLLVSFNKFITCSHCGNITTSNDFEVMITIDSKSASIQNGINEYFGFDQIEDFRCDKCGQRSNCFIQKILTNEPTLIMVHNLDGHNITVNDTISIDNQRFFVLSVIQIHGESDKDRHYNTIRRNNSGLWKLFDDEYVMPSAIPPRKKIPAYLVLYANFKEFAQPTSQEVPVFPEPQEELEFFKKSTDTLSQTYEEFLKMEQKKKEDKSTTKTQDEVDQTSKDENNQNIQDSAQTMEKEQEEIIPDIDHNNNKEHDKDENSGLLVGLNLDDEPENGQNKQQQEQVEEHEIPEPTEDDAPIYITQMDEESGLFKKYEMDKFGNLKEIAIDDTEMPDFQEPTEVEEIDRSNYPNLKKSILHRFMAEPKDREIILKDLSINLGYRMDGEELVDRYEEYIHSKRSDKRNSQKVLDDDKKSPRPRGRPRKIPDVSEDRSHTIPKRGRGRPRKHPLSPEMSTEPRRKRGRPRKTDISPKPTPTSSTSATMNVLEFRRSQRKSEIKKKSDKERNKRDYVFRKWHIRQKGEGPHASMIPKANRFCLPPKQENKLQCVLCGVKKYRAKNIGKLEVHYQAKHWRRIFEYDQYIHLLCKCNEMVSRKEETNRNAHHHCPDCFAILEKSDDIIDHLVNTEGIDEDSIKIFGGKYPKKTD